MKLLSLDATNFRSLRQAKVKFGDLSVFIGANASGKSSILDALRFLHEAVMSGSFEGPVASRGSIWNLAWKGEPVTHVRLVVSLTDNEENVFRWEVQLDVGNRGTFHVDEVVTRQSLGGSPAELLKVSRGVGTWVGEGLDFGIQIRHANTMACTLAYVSANETFGGRALADFVRTWGFFDPNPYLLRRDWAALEGSQLDHYGRNLAATLHRLGPDAVERIVRVTQDILGLPTKLRTLESEDRYVFQQFEHGFKFPVNQMGISSGTLRILALMTAIYGREDMGLVGIEEPENYVHPGALVSLIDLLNDERQRRQVVITTHSPLLLSYLGDPATINVVSHGGASGTQVAREQDPDGVKRALDASGFSLGEYHQTRGFGV